jgi:hypothetical protein
VPSLAALLPQVGGQSVEGRSNIADTGPTDDFPMLGFGRGAALRDAASRRLDHHANCGRAKPNHPALNEFIDIFGLNEAERLKIRAFAKSTLAAAPKSPLT